MQYSITESVWIITFDCVSMFELCQEDTGEWNSENVICVSVCETSTLCIQSFQKGDRFVHWEEAESFKGRSHVVAEIAKLLCGGFHFCFKFELIETIIKMNK